jgi:transposase
MTFYPESAVERTMKIQEVILRAMAKKITWWQAAEIIGISGRQMRRWYQRYQEFGYDGLFDRRLKRPSPKRVPVQTVEGVLGLYREKYFDMNVRHFCEKLREGHGIKLSYTWVKLALQGAGLVKKGRQRGTHRRRRPRRKQVGRALRGLGIRMIPAYSPQARGRSERHFGTWQGRLPQELRLRRITTAEEANRFLGEHYMAEFNRRFRVAPTQPGSAFLPCRRKDLDQVFSIQQERTVARDNTVTLGDRWLQIEAVGWRGTLAGGRVTVHEHLDETLTVTYGPHGVGRYNAQGWPLLEERNRRRQTAASRRCA